MLCSYHYILLFLTPVPVGSKQPAGIVAHLQFRDVARVDAIEVIMVIRGKADASGLSGRE